MRQRRDTGEKLSFNRILVDAERQGGRRTHREDYADAHHCTMHDWLVILTHLAKNKRTGLKVCSRKQKEIGFCRYSISIK